MYIIIEKLWADVEEKLKLAMGQLVVAYYSISQKRLCEAEMLLCMSNFLSDSFLDADSFLDLDDALTGGSEIITPRLIGWGEARQ